MKKQNETFPPKNNNYFFCLNSDAFFNSMSLNQHTKLRNSSSKEVGFLRENVSIIFHCARRRVSFSCMLLHLPRGFQLFFRYQISILNLLVLWFWPNFSPPKKSQDEYRKNDVCPLFFGKHQVIVWSTKSRISQKIAKKKSDTFCAFFDVIAFLSLFQYLIDFNTKLFPMENKATKCTLVWKR